MRWLLPLGLALAGGCTAVLGISAPAAVDGDGGVCLAETQTDVDHCGACDDPCSAQNGTPGCMAGVCSIMCTPGFKDCDEDPRETGCEANLATSPLHCGDCNQPCPTAMNADATCAVGAVCGLMCRSGFGDCEASAPDCETNLGNDTAHCGACEHSCLGGGCAARKCQAFDITTNAFHPGLIAVDDTHVYFIKQKLAPPYDLMRVAKDGLSAPELMFTPFNSILQIAVDGQALYFVDDQAIGGGLKRMVKTPGAPPETLLASTYGSFVLDGTDLYHCTPGEIRRLDLVGGGDTLVRAGIVDCDSLLVDATRVFWREPTMGVMMRTIYSASKIDGSGLAPLASNCDMGLSALQQDADFLYFKSSCVPGEPMTRIDKTTGMRTPVPIDQARLFLVDGERIYTMSDQAAQFIELRSYDKTGTEALVLYSAAITATDPRFLIADPDALYWSDEKTFTLRKIAK